MNLSLYLSRITLSIALGLSFFFLYSQSPLDSVKNIIHSSTFPDSLRADNAIRLSDFYIGRDQDSAIYYQNTAKGILEGSNLEALNLELRQSIISLNINVWELDTLVSEFDKLIIDLEKYGDESKVLSTLITESAMYLNRGMYEEGMVPLSKAHKLADRLGNKKQLAKILYNMAASYSNMSMMEASNEKLLEAYQVFMEVDNEPFALVSLNAVANNYNNIDQRDSARHYINLVLEKADSIKYTKLSIGARNTMGAILLSEKEYGKAKDYFTEAYDIAVANANPLTIGNCECNLGRVNYHLENYTEALKNLNSAYSKEVFKKNNLANHFCLKEMALVNKALGNHKQAGIYFEQYVQYQDTVLIKENKTVIAELNQKYEISKKEAALKEQEITIEKTKSQRNVLRTGLALSLLLGTSVIWGIIGRMRRNKKINMQEKKLQKEKISTLEKEKQLLSMSSILEGQEKERIRIAKDLHDGLGGLLTTAKAHFGKIQSEIEKIETLNIFNSANSMIDKAHDEVRRISHNLMPADLRAGGLPIAVRQLVHEMKTVHETPTELELIGFENLRIEENLEMTIYRIIQELLNNIVKYADASHVLIQLSKYESDIQVLVEDDGKGFDIGGAMKSNGLGIQSIITRVDQQKGEIDINTSPGNGTSVSMNFPIPQK